MLSLIVQTPMLQVGVPLEQRFAQLYESNMGVLITSDTML